MQLRAKLATIPRSLTLSPTRGSRASAQRLRPSPKRASLAGTIPRVLWLLGRGISLRPRLRISRRWSFRHRIRCVHRHRRTPTRAVRPRRDPRSIFPRRERRSECARARHTPQLPERYIVARTEIVDTRCPRTGRGMQFAVWPKRRLNTIREVGSERFGIRALLDNLHGDEQFRQTECFPSRGVHSMSSRRAGRTPLPPND